MTPTRKTAFPWRSFFPLLGMLGLVLVAVAFAFWNTGCTLQMVRCVNCADIQMTEERRPDFGIKIDEKKTEEEAKKGPNDAR